MSIWLKNASVLSITLALTLPQFARADVTWNGFLSVGGGSASPDEGEIIPGYGEYEKDFTFTPDTALGLQFKTQLTEKLTATGQIVARGVENYQADMAWAYLTYQASDEFKVRAGRLRTPFYLYSDYLEVGYAYHFINPPGDAYSLPADSIEGIDFLYEGNIGDVGIDTQVYFGSADSPLTLQSGGTLDVITRNQYGVVFTVNYDWLTLRASRHEAGKVSFEGTSSIAGFDNLIAGLNQFAMTPGLPQPLVDTINATSQNIQAEDITFIFDEFAIQIDWRNLLFVAEAVELTPDAGFVANLKRSYVSFGYRFGNVMPYLTYVQTDDVPVDLTLGLPDFTPANLIGGLNAISSAANTAPSRATSLVGFRYDFDPGASFKFEYGNIDNDVLLNGNDASGSLVRFAVDMVF